MTELEQQISNSITGSLSKTINETLGGYNSPLRKLVNQVFESERAEITSIVKSVMKDVIGSPIFKTTLKEEFTRKIAKNLVGIMEGQIVKATEVLKSDPKFKARMITSLEDMVETELRTKNFMNYESKNTK